MRGRMYAPTLAEDQAGQIESIAWETMKKKWSLFEVVFSLWVGYPVSLSIWKV